MEASGSNDNDRNDSAMSIHDMTDGESDHSLMVEDDLEDDEMSPQIERRRTRSRAAQRRLLPGGVGHWRNIIISKLAKSEEFSGRSITDSDVNDIITDLKNNGVDRNEKQIKQAVRDVKHFIKKNGPRKYPKYVKSKEQEEAFHKVEKKLTNHSVLQKKSIQKRKSQPAAAAKPSSDSGSLEKLTTKVDKIAEDLALLRSDVMKALSKLSESERSEKAIVFTERNEEEVAEELHSLLQLKNTTVTSSTTSNEYSLENFLGSGTFGVVFRAVERTQKKAVALKIVNDRAQADLERNFLNILLDSGKECSQYCCFPSDTFDFLHEGKTVYGFIMDLLRKDLFTMLLEENVKFSLQSIVQTLAQSFAALSFINSLGFIHSDMKLENIMMLDYNMRKVGDKEVVVEPRVKIIDANAMISIGRPFCCCQTARVRCPEVILGIDFDECIDTWSMGIIATEMIIGDFLFDFEYDATEHAKAASQVQMIEKVIGPIPQSLWDSCSFEDLKDAMDDNEPEAKTLEQILAAFSSDGYGMVLSVLLPSLLKTDPNQRPKPDAVAKQLAEFIS